MDKLCLNNICRALENANDNWGLKSRVMGVSLNEDPITGEKFINIPKVANPSVDSFRQFKFEKQLEILQCDSLPIFPLHDTLYIIDSAKFLDDGISYSSRDHTFRTVQHDHKKYQNKLFLRTLGIRDNCLIFVFSFKETTWNYLIYLDFRDDDLKITKTLLLDNSILRVRE